ncbi:Inner membrane protein YihN [Campylobacter jejuni]|nr:Inner membrane protein YihN [Campylobacter jejuni]
MSIVCIFGYSPQLFCFALCGFMMDHCKGLLGYQICFFFNGGFAICGVVVTTILLKMIARKKALKGMA